MIKIKYLRMCAGVNGVFPAGFVGMVEEVSAGQLVRAGAAVYVDDAPEPAPVEVAVAPTAGEVSVARGEMIKRGRRK